MPEVHSEQFIDAPVERVYSLAKEVERLPEFLPNVERVTIRSREGARTVTEWVGLVPEFKRKLVWVEEDDWDDAERRCTQVTLDITYEYNVPLIGPLIKKLLHKLVARSADETLEGLRKMAEETG